MKSFLNISLITLASIAASLSPQGTARALTIDTFPSWDGNNSVSSWGSGSTPTYGQTITIEDPVGARLDSFSFAVNIDTPQQYQARVYSWDPLTGPFGSSTGSPLYTGSINSVGGTGSLFETVTINTGGIFLPGGNQQYVILLTSEGLTGGGGGRWGYLSADVYTGGAFAFTNGPIDGEWDNFFNTTSDLAFSATFNSQTPPESVPGPLPILGATTAFGISRKLRRRLINSCMHQGNCQIEAG